MRAGLILIFLMCLSVGIMYASTDSNPTPDKAAIAKVRAKLDLLTDILGRLAAVKATPPSIFGIPPGFNGVSYCWTFEEGGPALYERVAKTLSDFHGSMRWNFKFQFNHKGACIAALANDNRFYTPILNSKLGTDARPRLLYAELDALCSYMERALGVVGQTRKSPTKDNSGLTHPYEPGIYDVTLVRDVRNFRWPTPTSEVDRQLYFGPTYEEWYALFFKILGAVSRQNEGVASSDEPRPTSFLGEIHGYPILSRLNDVHGTVVIDKSEVDGLESDCLKAEAISTGNEVARKCLEKLLLICRWAEHLDTGILLSGDDN